MAASPSSPRSADRLSDACCRWCNRRPTGSTPASKRPEVDGNFSFPRALSLVSAAHPAHHRHVTDVLRRRRRACRRRRGGLLGSRRLCRLTAAADQHRCQRRRACHQEKDFHVNSFTPQWRKHEPDLFPLRSMSASARRENQTAPAPNNLLASVKAPRSARKTSLHPADSRSCSD